MTGRLARLEVADFLRGPWHRTLLALALPQRCPCPALGVPYSPITDDGPQAWERLTYLQTLNQTVTPEKEGQMVPTSPLFKT